MGTFPLVFGGGGASGSSSFSSEGPWAECPFRPVDTLALSPQDTFARAKNWVKELQRQASPNIVIALAGNKADLASKRAVEFQVGGGLDPGRAGWVPLRFPRLQGGLSAVPSLEPRPKGIVVRCSSFWAVEDVCMCIVGASAYFCL